MTSDITVSTLLLHQQGTAIEAANLYTLAQSHDARLKAVRKVLDFACNELEINKHLKQDLSEDQLTIEICQFLSALGFQPRHDEQVGGHCDIVVRGKDMFLWLAEAKWHNSYGWLDKGFKQLSTRYSTGVSGQDQAEVVIYCKNKDAVAMMQNWRKELSSRNDDVKTFDGEGENPLEFWSEHSHVASGMTFKVRHKAVVLYHQPVDNVPA
ncbi:hypothetical protein K3552_09785 [Leisingera aquaemixtae]|uniref:hypothetical protein n=1 Tax=Leisingera aquaemixtae TaxID=1396826 RepID=UPI0021A550E5|nr:hypothetical protein [Leisingera aquaemixtae]UWQ35835.1 hypothetical protein K3552_09785 [Leisingera aquaemixtae]